MACRWSELLTPDCGVLGERVFMTMHDPHAGRVMLPSRRLAARHAVPTIRGTGTAHSLWSQPLLYCIGCASR